jgi:alpha-glucosidase
MRAGFGRKSGAWRGVGLAAVIAAAAGFAVPAAAQLDQTQTPTPAVVAQRIDAGPSEMIAEGVARFYFAGSGPGTVLPSFALLKPLSKTGDVAASWTARPSFARLADGRLEARLAIEPGTSLYGTGEVPGPLLRNGRRTITWNLDAYGYAPEWPNLYKSHPWVLAVRADGTAFGVLADTTWRTEILSGHEGAITFRAEGPEFPVIVIEGATPAEVVTRLAGITGAMPMPPKWAIGYHQCRYSYHPESRVREIAEGFRSRQIPCDVIWFDIDYMAGYRVFTFNPLEFPNPKQLNEDLGKMGFHRIWMLNPGMKAEDSPAANDPKPEELAKAGKQEAWDAEIARFRGIRDEALAKNFVVTTASGEPYRGAVWPGMCFFPDYTNDAVREWWKGLFPAYMANGVNGVWNDMNEPAIFNVASKTMPEDNRHMGGVWRSRPGMPEVTVPPGPHARFHNVYGMLMAQGTYEGIAKANPDKRPFVLTRATYLGGHRYAASWTGDNSATWNDLEQSVPMVLNLGLSGQAFTGPDIGGFVGNGPGKPGDLEVKGEFFARWMGIGAFLPFARGHTAKGADNKEPWAYTDEVTRVNKAALERRYRLLPYYYTLFHEAATVGLPVVRPVYWADLKDAALRSEDDAFLVGDALMVVPSLMPDASRQPVLPRGIWRSVKLVDGDDHKWLPTLKVRGGSIVPVGPVMQFVGEKALDPLTLIVSLDENGVARGTLYEDDMDGYDYLQGDFLLTHYVARRDGDEVVVTVEKAEGQRARPQRGVLVKVVTEQGVFGANGIDGQAITVPLK